MINRFDYSSFARRFAFRFPFYSYVGTQVSFWTAANIFIGTILHFHSKFIEEVYGVPIKGEISHTLVAAIFQGIFYGMILGTTEFYLEKYYLRRMPLGKIILLKAVLSLFVSLIILGLLSATPVDFNIPSMIPGHTVLENHKPWRFIFYQFIIFYSVLTLLISFINQVNKKYGPGIILPMLFGKYREPVEENRIFMFMDLKSSTTIAEVLGHLKYSSFIRDSFHDINQLLTTYNAEVYQYVGDEMVLSWKVDKMISYRACVEFFFACKDLFKNRYDYYHSNYGFFPKFKAGLHMGLVTAVEIGDVKRDIAYHGDTINTTARIQSVCNKFAKDLLISSVLLEKIGQQNQLITEFMGSIQLKGKLTDIAILSIERRS
ncbi:adenylate/guanylate cyclase domain-containing protein [Mucilaginibacter terrae]|uniref:Adenylate cyclase n=1 Tax=Mucilaginibacter terrae TaxID=1955052 RepID=A0ABU3GRG2_9SPHI|nr:adenylate/guanylate cyclase domain-containing protein [Mucilaginibacter terrae]MDT3402357.1 adenylate cyclase [Mucilaginibacter terrae]